MNSKNNRAPIFLEDLLTINFTRNVTTTTAFFILTELKKIQWPLFLFFSPTYCWKRTAYWKDNLPQSFDNPHILDSSNVNSLEVILLAIVGWCQAPQITTSFSISVRLRLRYLTAKSLGRDKTCLQFDW